MARLLKFLLPWGPVLFGVVLFAPMAAAVMDKMEFPATAGFSSLYVTLPVGLIWGLVAKVRGQWL
jgi:hypothetical protein